MVFGWSPAALEGGFHRWRVEPLPRSSLCTMWPVSAMSAKPWLLGFSTPILRWTSSLWCRCPFMTGHGPGGPAAYGVRAWEESRRSHGRKGQQSPLGAARIEACRRLDMLPTSLGGRPSALSATTPCTDGAPCPVTLAPTSRDMAERCSMLEPWTRVGGRW